ncbi:acetyl-CoA carboxylase biotin carboxyl carrier protein subunit [Rhizobium sp. AN69]|uniref:acetyl-CoA carboxylase biotin carboxyl carrier protein subunit n=1 Tax=Rhizobium sp. AN69 TaxID=3035213 RepID=UPI002B263AC8|nr:biotin/lipoyl-containing protein [Rhizobium sp. AN69]
MEAGDALVVMEAMKMEHTIRAPAKGTVTAINCAEGNMVEAGAMLVDFEPEGA